MQAGVICALVQILCDQLGSRFSIHRNLNRMHLLLTVCLGKFHLHRSNLETVYKWGRGDRQDFQMFASLLFTSLTERWCSHPLTSQTSIKGTEALVEPRPKPEAKKKRAGRNPIAEITAAHAESWSQKLEQGNELTTLIREAGGLSYLIKHTLSRGKHSDDLV